MDDDRSRVVDFDFDFGHVLDRIFVVLLLLLLLPKFDDDDGTSSFLFPPLVIRFRVVETTAANVKNAIVIIATPCFDIVIILQYVHVKQCKTEAVNNEMEKRMSSKYQYEV